MFTTLLLVTFVIAFAVSSIVILFFGRPIDAILERVISDKISKAWTKYLKFAIYVTGISSGVRIHSLEKYITRPEYKGSEIVTLNMERWILEVYRTVIGSLEGIAWMLLVFFIFALIAYVIVRVFELKKQSKDSKTQPEKAASS